MSMEDLLKSILGGAQAPAQGKQQANPLADLLGGILGGADLQPTGRAAASGTVDPIGAILGGRDGKLDLGDLARILGGVLGAGQAVPSTPQKSTAPSNLGANSFLAPIITELAQRLGLPVSLANTIVSFVLGQLLSRGTSASTTRAAQAQSQRAGPAAGEGLNLDYLLETVGAGREVEASYVRSTGIVEQLAAQTGLDKNTATRGVQQALQLLGGQLAAGRAPRAAAGPTDLDHLLDTWPS